MENLYKSLSNNELYAIYMDYVRSKQTGNRCESFVPYAKMIKENIGGDFTLREGIDATKQDFFDEVCRRFFEKQVSADNKEDVQHE